MRRGNEPLKRKSMHLLIQAAENSEDTTKSLVVLLGIFTGVRANTLCHLHAEWLNYEEGSLYLRVPNDDVCRKYGTNEPCGDCNARKGEFYIPKSEAGGGRRLKIPESWHNHYHSGDEEPLDLRDRVEQYFAIDQDGFGNAMLDGDGISVSTANRYVKEIAEKADIGYYRDSGYIMHSKLGRVPDVIIHDLRATYCVQLMRNNANPFKAINKTGHADVDSLKPYIEFAEGEIKGEFEEEFI